MKTYIGYRISTGLVVKVEGQEIYSLCHHVRHSPTGFEAGYGGSGPAELARCILIDYFYGYGEVPRPGQLATAMDKAELIYQKFKFDVVANLDPAGFELTEDQIDEWVQQQ